MGRAQGSVATVGSTGSRRTASFGPDTVTARRRLGLVKWMIDGKAQEGGTILTSRDRASMPPRFYNTADPEFGPIIEEDVKALVTAGVCSRTYDPVGDYFGIRPSDDWPQTCWQEWLDWQRLGCPTG